MVRRCVVLHQAVPPGAPIDEQDVLTSGASVTRALRAAGWDAGMLAMTGDLAAARAALCARRPDLVFNLVESLDGQDILAIAAVALLRALSLPFTGNDLAATALAADKRTARSALGRAGIAVPPAPGDGWRGRFIVKHVTEHASHGLGAHSVVDAVGDLPAGHYAEAFIEGRELNVSLLHGEALPIAELAFDDWPADAPRMRDYTGKWDTASLAFARTRRSFVVEPDIAARAAAIGHACWQALGLAGYARIDLRLAADGGMYVIDVNTNPCLDVEAGFAAAAAEAGLSYDATIARIADIVFLPPAEGGAGGGVPRTDVRSVPPPGLLPQREEGLSITLRDELGPADDIPALCRATGFFSGEEVAIARELAEARRGQGDASGYHFVLAEDADHRLLGYACYGAVPATAAAWDLYWIVVHPAAQGRGVGRVLVDAVAQRAAALGGRELYAETSGKPLYAPTRAFYGAAGFILAATLPDFYASGDAKLIWSRRLVLPADLR